MPTRQPTARLEAVPRCEALALLAGVPLGRVVFTDRALPAVRPVNHIVDVDGAVVIRAHGGAALLGAAASSGVVAYEADSIDSELRTGWSVIVTGEAHLVEEPEELVRYEGLLQPWVETDGGPVVRIVPELVTGYRLTPSPEA